MRESMRGGTVKGSDSARCFGFPALLWGSRKQIARVVRMQTFPNMTILLQEGCFGALQQKQLMPM
jgi:hypothetical protein